MKRFKQDDDMNASLLILFLGVQQVKRFKVDCQGPVWELKEEEKCI